VPKKKTAKKKTSKKAAKRTPAKKAKAAKKKTSKQATKRTPAKKAKAAKKKATPKALPKKRAPKRKGRMSAGELTRAEAQIIERMEALEPDEPRYQVLEAALAFKASWVILGEHLTDVHANKSYLIWGFPNFGAYCTEEVRVTPATAKKLVKSFKWLDEEAPDLLERGRASPAQLPADVPDYAAISVLADARREVDKERVTPDAYLQLKQAAFEGETTASQLRKELREAIPEELRKKPPPQDPYRALRKALNASVKTIDALSEWGEDDDILVQAEELRDAIAGRLPKEAAPSAA
jgi:hypothetical protein